MRIDIHQHLWTEPFVQALARRTEPPRLRLGRDGWTLRLAGEPDCVLDLTAEDPARRAALVEADGLDRALVCLSSPLGIEALPADEAAPLLDAYHAGATELPERFGAWGAVGLDGADPAGVDRLLDRGLAGVSPPAGALSTLAGLDRCGPLLERLERRAAPLLVHPGPAPWSPPAERAAR